LKLNKYQQIANRISSGASVLDVGCGSGALGYALKEKGCVLTGIDLKLDRLNGNRDHYQLLEERDIEAQGFKNEKYDVIVFSDVLEHLNDPTNVLKISRDRLSFEGTVLVSLPNVAYLDNRFGLMKGNWNYTDEGILDRTHLKFFTLSTADQLLISAGFKIQGIEPEIPIIRSAWKSGAFALLSKIWPGLFACGWVFQGYYCPSSKEV
jgi:2-polyprenyl-3-methyl-5-hydroxy-6-metoxy-1,4-benzoquinol methylase